MFLHMATAKNKSKGTRTRKSAPAKRVRGKLAPAANTRGLDAADVVIAMDSEEIAGVVALIRSAGGALIGAYRDPLGGRFESADLLTLGIVYEKASRFAGGAYSALLKKVDRFSDRTLPVSLREREGFAARLLEIDAQVKKLIAALQAKGFKSPYQRNYVVARINPVRFHKVKKGDTKPPMPLAEALTRMAAAAKSFKVESVSNSDLAWVAVGAGGEG